MKVTTVGLDLAKQVFSVHGVDTHGKAVLRKRVSRGKLLELFAQLPPSLVGMEACSGAHYWARGGFGGKIQRPNKPASFSVHAT